MAVVFDDLEAAIEPEEPIAGWLLLVRREYLEMPGLTLTKPQIQRLWGFDADTCDRVLEALEASGFLARTPQAGYRRSHR